MKEPTCGQAISSGPRPPSGSLADELRRAHRELAPAILAARRAGQDALADELTRARDEWAGAVARWEARIRG